MEEGAALSCTPGRLLLLKVSIVSLLCKTYGDTVFRTCPYNAQRYTNFRRKVAVSFC